MMENLILVFRFDLLYKKPINEWFDFNNTYDITIFSKLVHRNQIVWDEHLGVSDAFFAINNSNGTLNLF